MERFVAALWRALECIVFGIWRFIAWTLGGLIFGWMLSSWFATNFGGVDFDMAAVVALIGAGLGFIGRLFIEIGFLTWPSLYQRECEEK